MLNATLCTHSTPTHRARLGTLVEVTMAAACQIVACLIAEDESPVSTAWAG